ncbi:hypothetical protein BU23DRAFT_568799 [Bimuria novae-zelandiae CBS 107.79]|uniref:Uncharacterized protein n=1 Tax=Bimuria novae-zelandiae CBS 107.79 TaxID=1447943 RepID=A0A6A5V774_9PLEO|nr:hypothetical protein BU23DRAFT_568799 [Bimuria novae-zelandiae CBS 107.79]
MSTSDSTSSSSISPTLGNAFIRSIAGFATDQQAALSPESDLLVGYISQSVTSNIVMQLEQASEMTFQYTNNPAAMNGHTFLEIFDNVLYSMRGRSSAALLGIKRVIIVDIEDFIDHENEMIKNAFKRDNPALVPVRLIQQHDTSVDREVTQRFGDVLTQALESRFSQVMSAVSELRIRQLFTRRQTMHRSENGGEMGSQVCLLEVVEKAYEMPFDKTKYSVAKHLVAQFTIKCEVCKGRHTVKVVR